MVETTLSVKVFYNFLVLFVSSILAYLGIEKEPMLLFSILLIIDYATGLYKAKTLGHSITSNKMKYGIISKLSLLIIPIVLAIGSKAVGADFSFGLVAGLNILIISEIYSIIGNIYSSRTKEELPEWDAVAFLGRRLRTLLLKMAGDKDA